VEKKKRNRHKFRKTWKSLRILFKVLFVAILLFILIQLLSDFIEHYNILVKKVTDQQHNIQQLQEHLHTVSETNAQLNEQLQLTEARLELANLRIDELVNERITQQTPQVYLGGQPVVMTVEEVHEEVESQLKIPELPDSTVPAVLIGALTILRAAVFRIPAF
jgi:predicted nuclease with TOPRIM domain